MTITPSLFEAFLKCPSKCWLRANGEAPSGNPYAEWVQSQNESYRAAQAERLLKEIPADATATSPPPERLKASQWLLAVDVVVRTPDLPRSSRREEAPSSSHQPSVPTPQPSIQSLVTPAATAHPATPQPAFAAESHLHAVQRVHAEGRGKAAQFIPIRFHYRNKLTRDDKLLLAFDAFVLAQALGREVPIGKLIHGDDLATLKPKTSTAAGEVRKRLQKAASLLSNPEPPDLVLNRHCAECEFRDRCRKLALEKDDLSLLAGMSAKERQKLRSKGIFTVTQLSDTFSPRRRPKRLRDKREKHHHSQHLRTPLFTLRQKPRALALPAWT
jgi:predicted RecB family nuclease